MLNPTAPRALVVYETMFGNTETIATAIVDGLNDCGWHAAKVDVRWAERMPRELDLLVLGAPTHGFSLSRASTREEAVRRGALPARVELGLREWLAQLPPATDDAPLVAIFDTRASKVRRLPAAASHTISKLARRRGFHLAGRPQPFLVDDIEGPLAPGEVTKATDWGRSLAQNVSASTGRAS